MSNCVTLTECKGCYTLDGVEYDAVRFVNYAHNGSAYTPKAVGTFAADDPLTPLPAGGVFESWDKKKKTLVKVGDLWQLQNPEAEGVLLEYWQPSALGGSAVGHDNVTNIFGPALDAHPNPPDTTGILPAPSFSTATAGDISILGYADRSETVGTDQIRMSGYVCSTKDFDLIDTNTNTGERGAVTIDGVLVVEDTTDSIVADRTAFPATTIPAGVHSFKIGTSDLSAWQGVAPSGGDGVVFFTEQPIWKKIPVMKCVETGELQDCDGDLIEVSDKDFWCDPNEIGASECCDSSDDLDYSDVKIECANCCPDVDSPTGTFDGTAGGNSVSGTGTAAHTIKSETYTVAQIQQIFDALAAGSIVMIEQAGNVYIGGGVWGGTMTAPVANQTTFSITGTDHTKDLTGDPCAAELANILALASDGNANTLTIPTVTIFA